MAKVRGGDKLEGALAKIAKQLVDQTIMLNSVDSEVE